MTVFTAFVALLLAQAVEAAFVLACWWLIRAFRRQMEARAREVPVVRQETQAEKAVDKASRLVEEPFLVKPRPQKPFMAEGWSDPQDRADEKAAYFERVKMSRYSDDGI